MDGLVAAAAAVAAATNNNSDGKKKRKNNNTGGEQNVSAARARRLEQNRRAAIESRRRKKVMIAELQRSVTFYSKANENLKKANEELEKSLLQAKQKLLGRKEDDQSAVASEGLKTPEEERSVVEDKSSPEPKIEQQTGVPAVAAVPTLQQIASLKPPPVNAALADQAHLTAMQAVYENMGYSSAAERTAASVFSQFGTTTGLTDAKKPDHHVAPPAAVIDAGAVSASDEYIKSLEQFAMEKTAAANAATLAANTALRIASWHKMMKASSGQQMSSSSDKSPPPPESSSSSSVNKKE